MWNIFIIQLTQIEFKIWRVTFFKSFLPLIYLGGGGGGVWTSGFHAIDDWPRAHWDETEFNVMLLYYDFYLIKIPVYILSSPPLIKIQDKHWLFSVHFIWDRKHVYSFVLGFFTVMSFRLDSQTCQSIFATG